MIKINAKATETDFLTKTFRRLETKITLDRTNWNRETRFFIVDKITNEAQIITRVGN